MELADANVNSRSRKPGREKKRMRCKLYIYQTDFFAAEKGLKGSNIRPGGGGKNHLLLCAATSARTFVSRTGRKKGPISFFAGKKGSLE